jgi:hypothetical protein
MTWAPTALPAVSMLPSLITANRLLALNLRPYGAPYSDQVALAIASEKLKPSHRDTVGIWLQCPFFDPSWGGPVPFQITLPTMARDVVLWRQPIPLQGSRL